MSHWFDDLHPGWQVFGVVSAVMGLATLCAWLAGPVPEDRLRQYEVTLGDGTRATCVVVQGERAAGVTCVPHIVLGPDTEEDKP